MVLAEVEKPKAKHKAIEWQPSYLAPIEGVLHANLIPTGLNISEKDIGDFDRIMYSVGSHKMRRAVVLCGLQRDIETAKDIHAQLKKRLPSDTAIPPMDYVERCYIGESLYPAGIFSRQKAGKNYLYSMTLLGEKAKVAAAAFTVYERDTNRTLESVLGPVTPKGVDNIRPYINRTAILLALYTKSCYRAEVADATGLSSSALTDSLQALKNAGLVYQEPAKRNTKGLDIYEVSEDYVFESYTPKSPLERDIVEFFKINHRANMQTILEAFSFSKVGGIGRILSRLKTAGFLKSVGWNLQVKNLINLTDNGREFVDRVIISALKASKGEYEDLAMYGFDSRSACDLIPALNGKETRRTMAEVEELILKFIDEHGAAAPHDIINSAGKTAKRALLTLAKSGDLIRRKDIDGSFYLRPGMEVPTNRQKVVVFEYKKPEAILTISRKTKEFPPDEELRNEWKFLQQVLVPEMQTRAIITKLFKTGLTKYPYYYYRGKEDIRTTVYEVIPLFSRRSSQEPKTAVQDNIKAIGLDDEELRAFSDDAVRAYLHSIGKVPLLTRQEEVNLARGIKICDWQIGEMQKIFDEEKQKKIKEFIENTRNELVRKLAAGNLRLVVSIAKKYMGMGVSLLDLIGYGNEGLMKAIEKFDFKRGFKFSTYAFWWIRQSIAKGATEFGKKISAPIRQSRKGIPVESLNTLMSDGKSEVGNFIEDEDASVVKGIEYVFLKEDIDAVLSVLSYRERVILELRLGINDGRKRTLEEIGIELGLSGKRVRQIEAEVLTKLRTSEVKKKFEEYLE